ncbi:hypothetical protein IAU60_005566 [Kwoniella sp. DSM 27419]
MASPLKTYLGRSIDLFRRSTAKMVKMDAAPRAEPTTIFSFNSAMQPVDDPSHFGMGADSEVGGLSTCKLALIPGNGSIASGSGSGSSSVSGSGSGSTITSTPAASSSSDVSHIAFHGYMSTRVPPTQAGKIRTGYAGFRNTSRPTLFGQDTWDLDIYTHLKIVVGYRGWEGWRNRWVVNIGIDGRPKSDVFQHRLELPPNSQSTSSQFALDPLAPPPPQFTTVHLPLSSFVLIKKGQIASSPVALPRSLVRTVGFALLGRDRGDDGPEGSPVSQGLKSLKLGGWGRASAQEAQDDPELKALLEEDQQRQQASNPAAGSAQVKQPPPRPAASRSSGGYHRVGSNGAASSPTLAPATGEVDAAVSSPSAAEEREGYYELCVRSVEAVKWDPEADAPEEVAA